MLTPTDEVVYQDSPYRAVVVLTISETFEAVGTVRTNLGVVLVSSVVDAVLTFSIVYLSTEPVIDRIEGHGEVFPVQTELVLVASFIVFIDSA